MSKEDRFHTKDLNLASAVALLSGLDPACEVDERGKVAFIFPDDSCIRQSVLAYHDGAASPLCEYVDKLRSLRSAMFAAKGE